MTEENQNQQNEERPEVMEPAQLLQFLTPENVVAFATAAQELKEAIADIPAQLEFANKVNLAKSFMRQVCPNPARPDEFQVHFDSAGFARAWLALSTLDEETAPPPDLPE